MRSSSALLALGASTASAVYQGFNYGATKSDNVTPRVQSDFEALFSTAKTLVGTSGFTSARLYTMIQSGTTDTPTSAIPAAIAEDTSLLLTLWASGDTFDDELAALKSAITTYPSLSGKVAGISVGSEDLYRNSPTGIAAGSTVGANPDTIVDCISQVRTAIAGTFLADVGVGHVDTWTAWVNSSNDAVITASDWIGVDAYPYFQNTVSNGIDEGAALFNEAIANTKAVVGSKDVWITETGWPVSGSTENLAVPSTANAKTYWDDVGCPNFGVVNTWWYTLEDTDVTTPNPSFGITTGNPLSTTPLFDLSCSNVTNTTSSTATVLSTAPTVTGGSGVSPSGMGGSGSNVTATGAISTATGSSSSSGNTTATSVTLSTSAKPTVTASSSSTVSGTSSSGATMVSSSFSGAVVALFVAFAL